MGRRRLISSTEAATLLGIATDEDGLIRCFTLDPADRLECELRRRPHNKLGFAAQLCIMRQTGRLLWDNEQPPVAAINYLADQLGIDPRLYDLYAHRVQTRFDHSRHLMNYLGLRAACKQDRRAAMVAAFEAATDDDSGLPIAAAIVGEFRKRSALLPSLNSIEKIGLGGRAIARRRAENELIAGVPRDRLQSLDRLLEVDPSIGQTRFHWLRSAPEAPGASNLVGLTERIAFLRTLEIDPTLQTRISAGRWDQMIREGNATPAWLANDFNASRRHALILAQVIKLCQKLTDDAVTMFIKLMGKLFSQANNRKKQRQMDCRANTAKALRMFLDTITALQSANDDGRNALDVLDQKVGWHRLLRMKPELESMVDDNEASPLVVAGEQYATVGKYTGAFLQAFTFRSARRHDPLLAAIALLKQLYAERRRTLPERVPVTHLSQTDRRLIFEQEKPNRRLYEIATLAALRGRLRAADIWVEGSRSFRPIDEHLMPRSTFISMKEVENEGEEAVPAVDDFLLPTRTGPNVRRAVDLAIATSVREVMWTSGARNFDEEHQTASFMGLLTSNLTWHLLMAGVQGEDGDTLQFPEISWAHFGKTAESRKGADFGLLARPLDGSYRLTLFQAKRAKSGVIDAGYIIGKRSILPDTSAYGAMCSYYANDQEWRDSNPDEFTKVVSVLRELKIPKYQLEAFMATNLLGQPRSYCHIPWCYYAVWGESAGETSAAEPRAITAEEIMTSVARSGGLSPGPFHVLGDSKTLTDIVSNVLRGSSAETYIHIGDEDIANLLAKISTLLPDLQLIGIDDEGKGVLINALRNNGFTVRRQNLELAGQSFEPKIASHTYRRT